MFAGVAEWLRLLTFNQTYAGSIPAAGTLWYNTLMLKKCTSCQEPKELFEFASNSSKSDGLSNMCKPCKKIYNSQYYNNTKSVYSKSRAQTREDLRNQNRLLIQQAKDVPCNDCGIKYPYYVMDFDHRIPSQKKNNVSNLINYSTQVLLNEISKCDVVCANCHRMRTHGSVAEW